MIRRLDSAFLAAAIFCVEGAMWLAEVLEARRNRGRERGVPRP